MASPRAAPPSARKKPPAPPTGQSPDEVIGEFRRGKEIGKGSFATVYLAQHRKKKSFAAMKVVAMAGLRQKLKDGIAREVKSLKDLHHPNITALFTTLESPTHFYLLMEYCQLSDLSQFLKKRTVLATLPETEDIFRRYPNPEVGGFHEVLTRHFVKQIAAGLEHLRANNIAHRDIKPQNLLLTPAPSYLSKQRPEDLPYTRDADALISPIGLPTLPMVKIADFGFARELKPDAMAETLCGSPLYMAPEILRYERYTAKADLWSAGAVLYEIVAGRAPFKAPNHLDLLRKIDQANNYIAFDKKLVISRPMKELIRKLLNKYPLERVTFDGLKEDPVITGDIPGLVPEDVEIMRQQNDSQVASFTKPSPADELPLEDTSQARNSSETSLRPKKSQDEVQSSGSRKSSDQERRTRPDNVSRRKSSAGTQNQAEPVAVEMQRRPSQREQPKQRRPSMVAHATAPARQELLTGVAAAPSSAPRMERRPSRTSPLTGPPMVREPSAADPARFKEERGSREARDRIAQDMAFEKEYVVVEKRAVEINAFADELDANRNGQQALMTRRATTQGHPAPVAGVQPASPSRAMQVASGRPQGMHQRTTSFERRYAPSPQSATNMLTKALNAANVRLFGALGTSPPFGKGQSPPRGYGAFPVYPAPQGTLLLRDGNETKTPMDEDTRIVRTMEEAGHRSEVIYGFAEVKYRQLLPATPSSQDALGIQQITAPEKQAEGSGKGNDKDMTIMATVGVAEEALVLYVKTLAILAKTIDLAGYWWNKQNRTEPIASDSASRPSNASSTEVGKRMNNVVQWARSRFNECLEKSEVVGRRLQAAQRQLPEDHPGHPYNQDTKSSGAGGGITTSAENIMITTGVTAESLMYDRAVEMSRAAAVSELVGEDLNDCEIGYVTAIMLWEAVLENDDEPLMRKPSARKDKAPEELINGMETADRQHTQKRKFPRCQTCPYNNANGNRTVIESAKTRLSALRKKMQMAQQVAKRSSQAGSGNATPKAAISPAPSPAIAGTPPK